MSFSSSWLLICNVWFHTINYRVSGQAHTSLMTNGIGELSACSFNIDLNDWSIKSYTLLFYFIHHLKFHSTSFMSEKCVHQVNCGKMWGCHLWHELNKFHSLETLAGGKITSFDHFNFFKSSCWENKLFSFQLFKIYNIKSLFVTLPVCIKFFKRLTTVVNFRDFLL